MRHDWDANDIVPKREALVLAKARVGGFNAEIDRALDETLRTLDPGRNNRP